MGKLEEGSSKFWPSNP